MQRHQAAYAQIITGSFSGVNSGDNVITKRECVRFSIPGTILYYKKIPRFFGRGKYSEDYYPVLNLSRGGLKFVSDQKLGVGVSLALRIHVPGIDLYPEILARVRWIARNPEPSYRYQTGVSFNSYGTKKNDNPEEVLAFIKALERDHGY